MTQNETDFADPSPWNRPWFILAAVFVGLVALIGVVVAVWPHHDSPPSSNGPQPTAASSNGTSEQPGPAVTSLPTTLPASAPAVSWQVVGQNAVPVSKGAGPRTVTGGVAAGFAHTPVGALIAAAQFDARAAFSAGRDSWEPTLQRSFVAGPDRDLLLANLKAAPAQKADPGEVTPLAGYVYQAYTPDTAVIGLVYRAPNTNPVQYHVVTSTLQWRGGDWRMVAPPGGSWQSVNHQANDLTGVVQWGNG